MSISTNRLSSGHFDAYISHLCTRSPANINKDLLNIQRRWKDIYLCNLIYIVILANHKGHKIQNPPPPLIQRDAGRQSRCEFFPFFPLLSSIKFHLTEHNFLKMRYNWNFPKCNYIWNFQRDAARESKYGFILLKRACNPMKSHVITAPRVFQRQLDRNGCCALSLAIYNQLTNWAEARKVQTVASLPIPTLQHPTSTQLW